MANPEMDARVHAERWMSRPHQKGVAMNERQWELYRLSVVEKWSDSPYKRAVSAAIEHKLMILRQHPAALEAKNDASRTRYAV